MVYSDAAGTQELFGDGSSQTWTDMSQIPGKVYVAGTVLGGATLTWTVRAKGNVVGSDSVRFTVSQINIKIDNVADQYKTTSGSIVWRNSGYSKDNVSVGGTIYPNYDENPQTNQYTFDPLYTDDCTPATVDLSPGFSQTDDVILTFDSNILVWDLTGGYVPGSTPPRITSGTSFHPSSDHLQLEIEGLDPSASFGLDSIIASAFPRSAATPAAPTSTDTANYTVLDVNAAVDGNRDQTIQYSNYDDHNLTFWYNDNHDITTSSLGYTYQRYGTGPLQDCNSNVIRTTCDLEDYAVYHMYLDPKLSTITTQSGGGITSVSYAMQLLGGGSTMLNIYQQYGGDLFHCDPEVTDTSAANSQVNNSQYNTAAIFALGGSLRTLPQSCSAPPARATSAPSFAPTRALRRRVRRRPV